MGWADLVAKDRTGMLGIGVSATKCVPGSGIMAPRCTIRPRAAYAIRELRLRKHLFDTMSEKGPTRAILSCN
jgi:hypothetical protein